MLIDIITYICLLIIAIVQFILKRNSVSGIILYLITGIATYYSGSFLFLTPVLLYQLLTIIITQYNLKEKKQLSEKYNPQSEKNLLQTTSEIIVPLIIAIVCIFMRSQLLEIAFYISINIAITILIINELCLIHKQDNISLITYQQLSKNNSGGINFVGIAAGFCSSLIVSLIYFLFTKNFLGVPFIALYSFLGAIINKLLSDLWENSPKFSKKMLQIELINIISTIFITGIFIIIGYIFF